MKKGDVYMRRGGVIIIIPNVPRNLREQVQEMFTVTLSQLENVLSVPAEEVRDDIRNDVPLAGTPAGALKAYREREGYTQAELAKKTGIAQGHISDMERGKRAIGLKSARILAKALSCKYERLLR